MTGGEPDRSPAARPGADRLRARPRAPALRCRPESSATLVPCWSASAPAAVGSRSRRPSSPQSGCARPGIEIALVPITTAGDRDRTRPFGEIGARGVFVKELEEALLAGRIDVAVHSAKDMTSTDTEGLAVGAYLDARGSARRALRRRRSCGPGMRIGTASVRRRRSCSRSSRRCRSSRCAATSTRGCASAASAGSTRSCSPPAASTGSASATRSGTASSRTRCSRRRDRARSRSRCARARRSSSARADDAETRRRVEAERACVAVIGGGCLAPVAAYHDGDDADRARRRRGRQLDRAPQRRRSRPQLAAAADAVRLDLTMRVIVTRPQAQGEPSLARLRGARPRAGRVPADRDRAARRRSDRRRRLRLGRRHEPRTAPRELARAAARRAPAGSPPSGRGRPRRSRRRDPEPSSSRRSRRRRGCSPSSRGRRGASSSPAPRARRRLLVDELGADFVPLYRTSSSTAGAARRRPRRARLRLRPRARLRAARLGAARVSIGPADDGRRAERPASTSSPRPRRTISTASWTQSARRGALHHVPHRLRPAGRLRRHLPRRDEADRARRRRSSTSRTASRRRASSRARSSLANTLPYMPDGVHLAVVDPGVGGARRAARAARRRAGDSSSAPTTAC